MIDRRLSDFLTLLTGGVISGYVAFHMVSAALVDGSYMQVGNGSMTYSRRQHVDINGRSPDIAVRVRFRDFPWAGA
jgi:hypothetical protein